MWTGLSGYGGLNIPLTQSYSAGGSQNNSQNIASSDSMANVAGIEASQWSAEQARLAHERQKELLKLAQDFNSAEAEKTRKWQQEMANTVYTRSVENMKEAGINPILASQFGLSAGNVSSAQTASTGVPNAVMGQTFAEQNSASHSRESGNSSGSSWENSESGLATALNAMGGLIGGLIDKINGNQTIEIALNGFEQAFENGGKTGDKNGNGKRDIEDSINEAKEIDSISDLAKWLGNELNPFNSPFFNSFPDPDKYKLTDPDGNPLW